MCSLKDMIVGQQQANRLQVLPDNHEHALVIETLPLHHRDPFDRLLIAQAMAENAALLSCDAVLDPYPVTRIW